MGIESEPKDKGPLPNQPEKKVPEETLKPSSSKEDTKSQEHGWKFKLTTLLAVVAGLSVGMSLYRKDRIETAAQPLRQRWDDWLEVPDDAGWLLRKTNMLEEEIRKHNQEAPWHEPTVSFNDVVPPEHLRQAIQENAHYNLTTMKNYEFKPSREFQVGPNGIVDDAIEGYDSRKLRDYIKRLKNIDALAETGHMTLPQVLGEEDSTFLEDKNLRVAQSLWQHIQTVVESGEAAKRRRFYSAQPGSGDGKRWQLSDLSNLEGRDGFKVPGLIKALQDLVSASGIEPAQVDIQPSKAREIAGPEIKALWLPIHQDIKYPPREDPIVDSVVQISALARFADEKPTSFIDVAEWRAGLGRKAGQMFKESQSDFAQKVPSEAVSDLWRGLFLLEHGSLRPTDREVGLDDDEFQRLIQDYESVKKKNQGTANFWDEMFQRIDASLQKDRDKTATPPESQNQGRRALDTHKAFLRQHWENMLAQKTPPNA